MIFIYFLIIFLFACIVRKSIFIYLLSIIPYFFIIYFGRDFDFQDDMYAYYEAYLSKEYTLQFGFFEVSLAQIYNFLSLFSIDSLPLFNIIIVLIETILLFSLFVRDRFTFLIFLTVICSSNYIINSGLFVRQMFASIIILYALLNKNSIINYLQAITFHNSSAIFYIINLISGSKFFIRSSSLLIILFIVSFITQPLDVNFFIMIFGALEYDKILIWESNEFESNRLPITSFLMTVIFIGYNYYRKKNQLITNFMFMLIIVIYLFGKVPFLASRAGIIALVFSPFLLYEIESNIKLRSNVTPLLLFFFFYTNLVFLYKSDTYFYELFSRIFIL